MSPVLQVIRVLLGGVERRAVRRAMLRGAALSVAVLAMGAALLGLSGWFVTAAGLAGIAGIGIGFDMFRPSAGVRFLALGRAAARYGERVLTHDATLRALTALRVSLLRGQARRDARGLARLRGETALTRIVADVDALDGLALRVLLPAAAGLAAQLGAAALLAWLVGWPVALAVGLGFLPASAWILARLARRGLAPSDRLETARQSLRRGVIDMIRDREALILAGRLGARETDLVALDAQARAGAAALDRAERRAGFALACTASVAAAAALMAGAWLLSRGAVDPAQAVIGLFVALALAETVLPLRRGFAELGRMVGAARRIAPETRGAPPPAAAPSHAAPLAPLLRVDRPEAAFDLGPGQTVALTGPSGAGKTTLLLRIAGLAPGGGVAISGRAPRDWPEGDLRAQVALLPQRSALIAGTVRENLALAGPATDEEMRDALAAAGLETALAPRGGLDAPLGEGGAGLSGGQARRLVLARVLLKRPALLMLDEPTEGLDNFMADAVLNGVRRALPHAAILVALHRGADHPVFDRVVPLRPVPYGDATPRPEAETRCGEIAALPPLR
ncbi:ATP-binding cassette, subfamily C, CydC [Albimonas donghaensis]|uniref:ATP-binding cassette, subfamily C, CydC n=1 Tax=Albimonas donghaensis TaxID=356660 RepID=A0A1H3AAL8_9RHOB|nr:ATP-binding cassette domain-containing protein [Albimonas donghaensis]SDX26683.1 ATP-binding cassette, subfamily C, CydC [Albimonas donghaensis]